MQWFAVSSRRGDNYAASTKVIQIDTRRPYAKPTKQTKKSSYNLKAWVAHHPKINGVDRCLLQIMLLSAKGQRFRMSREHQAEDLGVSRWTVNEARRRAVACGLWTAKGETLERIAVIGETEGAKLTFERLFNCCRDIGLGLRSMCLRIDLAAVATDGKAHTTIDRLAGMLDADPHSLRQVMAQIDREVGLFKIERGLPVSGHGGQNGNWSPRENRPRSRRKRHPSVRSNRSSNRIAGSSMRGCAKF